MLSERKKEAKIELKNMITKLESGKRYIKGIGLYLIPNIIIRRKTREAIKKL